MPASLHDTIAEEVQAFALDAIVELFVIDATNITGGSIYRFTSTSNGASAIIFDGNTYVPINFESEGWEWSGKGTLPRPKIRISNATKLVSAAVISLNDLLGAEVQRIRTFAKHLDGGSDPDPTKIFPTEYFIVQRKTNHNKVFIEFELSCAIDQDGLKIPRRLCLSTACDLMYRQWDGAAFDYTYATCPYAGSNYFTIAGNPTLDGSLDDCPRTMKGCKQRFGTNSPLPTHQMPALGL